MAEERGVMVQGGWYIYESEGGGGTQVGRRCGCGCRRGFGVLGASNVVCSMIQGSDL